MTNSEKDLVVVLNALFNELDLAEFSLDDADFDKQNPEIVEKVFNIRSGVLHLKDLTAELLAEIEQRVYCVEVESTVTQTIKILAKNEDDALAMATDVGERRLRLTLGREHDYDVYSSSVSLGDESQADDEAEEEYPYDGR